MALRMGSESRILSLVALFFVAIVNCGTEPTYVTGLGIEVFHESGTDYSAHAIDTAALHIAELRPNSDLDGLDGVMLTLKNKVRCGEYTSAGGCTWFDPIRTEVAAIFPCVGDSAWPHELVHIYDELEGLEPDYAHERCWQYVEEVRRSLSQVYCLARVVVVRE